MTDVEVEGLEQVRTGLARLSLGTAARESGLAIDRPRAVEGGAPPSVFEIERLARVYSVEADCLWDEPIRVPSGDEVVLLTSLDEFTEVGDLTRAKILRAASAARDFVWLRRLVDEPEPPWFPPPPPQQLPPWEQGAALAEALRRECSLGIEPLRSVRELVSTRFSWIGLLYSRLGTRGAPAGLGFAGGARGPTIVLNLEGKNVNALVRRFSLAHELCHLLADWHQGTSLTSISGFLTDTGLAREQRANAFAARLLCPPSVVQGLTSTRDEDAARLLMEEFGLHYSAARLYLGNEGRIHLPPKPPPEIRSFIEPAPRWIEAEAPRGVEDFPVADAPTERRGAFAEVAARAYANGVVGRDALARLLGLTPGPPLAERLAYFDLDAPDPAASPAVA